MGDGLLRDMMLLVSDYNMDGALSEQEITFFYREVLEYTYYVAHTYGRSFIEIADLDHDDTLNPHGKWYLVLSKLGQPPTSATSNSFI